jgi:hypothetical protein
MTALFCDLKDYENCKIYWDMVDGLNRCVCYAECSNDSSVWL